MTTIKEIRERCERATDAMRLPWALRPYDHGERVISIGSGHESVCLFTEEDTPQADFIINAPSDVRHLLALIARCAEMLRKHERDGTGSDGSEICPECERPYSHTLTCPYAALMRDLAAHDAESTNG